MVKKKTKSSGKKRKPTPVKKQKTIVEKTPRMSSNKPKSKKILKIKAFLRKRKISISRSKHKKKHRWFS